MIIGKIWEHMDGITKIVYLTSKRHKIMSWERAITVEDQVKYKNMISMVSILNTKVTKISLGPLNVSRGTSGNDLHNVFMEAGVQAGHALTEDVNGFRYS